MFGTEIERRVLLEKFLNVLPVIIMAESALPLLWYVWAVLVRGGAFESGGDLLYKEVGIIWEK